jgi:hypothetical protein
MAKKKVFVPHLTVKQLIDALNHRMSNQDPVIIKWDDSDEGRVLLTIKKIEGTESMTFEITGEICLSKGYTTFTGIFKGDPWKTLEGEITFEEK